ncbi:hypothetical protein FTV94_06040 [Escherichia coli]|nr:hypothetical protein FTV94_06040 [Escherichia coli]
MLSLRFRDPDTADVARIAPDQKGRPAFTPRNPRLERIGGHCCKVSDEAAFCLIQRPYISKTLLTRRISPGDHHNKMLRPGLCVVHASPQYL